MTDIVSINGIECYEHDGTVYLKLETVVRGLGFTQTAKSGNEVVRWERVHKYLNELGIPTCGDDGFIPENIFYRLAMKAKNEVAERFQAKVADEIIPSIRKHGAYMTPETLEAALLNPDTIIKIATALKEEQQKNRVLQEEVMEKSKIIDEQLPSVEFTKKVADTKDLITMAQMAKLTHDENIPLGRNKLIQWLKDKKYLRQNGEPFQQYINQGYFKVRETSKQTAYGSKVFTQTFVTGRGQIYLIEKLRKEFCEPENVA